MCRPENFRRSVETINKALGGLKKMDLFEPARIAGNATIEEMIATLAALKAEGHFAHIGLSECSAASLRKAHAVRVHNLRIQFAQLLTHAPVNRSTLSRLSRLKLICGRTRKRPRKSLRRRRSSASLWLPTRTSNEQLDRNITHGNHSLGLSDEASSPVPLRAPRTSTVSSKVLLLSCRIA